jgi:hypothetical protein
MFPRCLSKTWAFSNFSCFCAATYDKIQFFEAIENIRFKNGKDFNGLCRCPSQWERRKQGLGDLPGPTVPT